MEILIKALQFILSISILVTVHEFGHYLPAVLFKTRVEKFYLFFNPWFSLVKKKIKGTEYGIGWLPLGGYVKISGMVDESMDNNLDKEEKEWEFRAKAPWQRFIILVGGVVMNVITAMVIYTFVLWTYGQTYLSMDDINTHGVVVNEIGEGLGLQNGDKIISIDGKKIERYTEFRKNLLLGDEITIERGGQPMTLPLLDASKKDLLQNKQEMLSAVVPRMPYIVQQVVEGSPAESVNLRAGDKLISLNGVPMMYADQYQAELPQYASQEIMLGIDRDGVTQEISITLNEEGKMGVYLKPINQIYPIRTASFGFFESIPLGIAKAYDDLVSYVRQFKLVFNSETEGYKQVGGLIAIGNMFPSTWDWEGFWRFTAFFSIALAFLNILPIPALDGGHLVFVVYEMITGRKPGEKVLRAAQSIGVALVLGLILFTNGNDILRLFGIQL